MTAISKAPIHQKTHRLIASRFPTVGVFDDLTGDPQDLRGGVSEKSDKMDSSNLSKFLIASDLSS